MDYFGLFCDHVQDHSYTSVCVDSMAKFFNNFDINEFNDEELNFLVKKLSSAHEIIENSLHFIESCKQEIILQNIEKCLLLAEEMRKLKATKLVMLLLNKFSSCHVFLVPRRVRIYLLEFLKGTNTFEKQQLSENN